jgi:Fur family ferric uptake transcriptional regulator
MNTPKEIIEALGLRYTASRLAVLSVLTNTTNALTHQEVLNALDAAIEYDRVTIYRVLDWLVENSIAHKVVGQDRAWRFQLTRDDTQHRHAHFQCTDCRKVYCLAEIQPELAQAIPAHFTVNSVELNLKGRCADCESHRV